MKTLMIIAVLILTGCQTLPDYDTGDGFWKYGIQQEGNTGRMTAQEVTAIPVVYLRYEDLLIACGEYDERTLAQFYKDHRALMLRACLVPRQVDGLEGSDVIYSYWLNWGKNNFFIIHERGHAYWGESHSSCWGKGYGLGEDANACEWEKS